MCLEYFLKSWGTYYLWKWSLSLSINFMQMNHNPLYVDHIKTSKKKSMAYLETCQKFGAFA